MSSRDFFPVQGGGGEGAGQGGAASPGSLRFAVGSRLFFPTLVLKTRVRFSFGNVRFSSDFENQSPVFTTLTWSMTYQKIGQKQSLGRDRERDLGRVDQVYVGLKSIVKCTMKIYLIKKLIVLICYHEY
jgi:hypothetical protein